MQAKTRKPITNVVVLTGLLLVASASQAADVYLRAEAYTKTLTLPDSSMVNVPMWGFADCGADATFTSCGDPGPQINVSTADTLDIHVRNNLSTPVSVVIPGQIQDGARTPVMVADGQGRMRMQSMTYETAPGGTATYSWSAPRPGTYLYQSGTHPSIQVPMGLYGALVVDPAVGAACAGTAQSAYDDLDSCYDEQTVLLFSEIDPTQNAATAAAASVATYPSTVDYSPIFLLVNGELTADLPTASVTGGNVLLRMLNAGLRSHSPSIVGIDMGLIAEDGNRYPGSVARQATVMVAAGKTLDAMISLPAGDDTFSLFDRTPSFNNADLPLGGMVANLDVGAGAPDIPDASLAVDDDYSVVEDTALMVNAGSGVLANDSGLTGSTVVTDVAHGTLNLAADGSFDYTPDPDFSGSDSFTYSASTGGVSYGAQVTLDVSFVNDPPVAAADGPYVNGLGGALVVSAAEGVLGNDTDVDGDTLTAVMVGVNPDIVLNADGSFVYSGSGGTTFQYQASDGLTQSAPVAVTVDYIEAANISLTVESSEGGTVSNYRWIVQEDRTYRIDPTDPLSTPKSEMLALNFHKSSMPVVAQGCTACDPVIPFSSAALDPTKHYYVSVLPHDAATGGHTIGGAQIAPGQTSVTVRVNKQEIPTAQITVQVFEDIAPTNGVPDPGEPGLGGFQVVVEDAGGRYGISGGAMSQDAFGNPLTNSACPGAQSEPGIILSCPDGSVLIENLVPGKYGIIVTPKVVGETWTQTSTIEGKNVIDAWVKAGEPPFFLEFGGPGPHVFVGFVNPDNTTVPDVNGPKRTITGRVTMLHDPRPPGTPGSADSDSYVGLGHTRAWVGLNSIAGDGPNFQTVQANEDGEFTLTGIPHGNYQLVIWDDYLDQIIAFQTVTVDGNVDVGNVPVFTWFTRAEHSVFLDENENGIWDDGEAPLAEQAVNLRWRDGTVNQSFPTDLQGMVPFDEVFPFFNWQVFEVDYTRLKPTGVTVTVDAGGEITSPLYPGLLEPQDGSPRTELGPVLTQGFQGFPMQTAIFEWGKAPYEPGENGGISGIVFYGSTRGEADPRLTVGDPWEPGIAGVKVRLYREIPAEGGGTALTLVEEVTTDSWDDSLPTGCLGEDPSDVYTTDTLNNDVERCYDGFRNWNQVRPATFDGGYAFNDIPAGTYVVEVVPPPGYELIKEQDVNVGFGESYGSDTSFTPPVVTLPNGTVVPVIPDQAMIDAAKGPEPGIAQPPCVGLYQEVPDSMSLFPHEDAPFAGAFRPLCDRKRVILSDQGQAAADFHLFTSTPVAAQYAGLITDDLSNESDPRSPGFGEKWSPAFLPFSIRDFKGHEVYRGYGDAYGHYNGLAPSTFTANVPIPSGYSPAMLATCLNDPGIGPDFDPLRLPNYSNSCYTLQFMPGTTTYLDTPVLPTAAFAAGFYPADCAAPALTPVIATVDGSAAGFGPLAPAGGTLTITSRGTEEVDNPDYAGPNATTPETMVRTIMRDHGFGVPNGVVTLDGIELPIVSWNDSEIVATIPVGTTAGAYQLGVTRDGNGSALNTVTVTVSDSPADAIVTAGGSIQAAIDAASDGDLILVGPGTYEEFVIMHKAVRLQGAGANTIINAIIRPTEKLQTWIDTVEGLFDSSAVDPLPGQTDFALTDAQGAGITVLSKNDGSWNPGNAPRIDGFTITGADVGGGVHVNGWAHYLQISNNNITGNSGNQHGGIRIGQPFLPLEGGGPFAFNENVNVHNNAVVMNGALSRFSVGGGIGIADGSNNYQVTDNLVCGNFSAGDGAGIGHLGFSDNGLIRGNEVLYNQSLDLSLNAHGGGILISGELPEPPALTRGAGDVTIDSNLVQGNQAASGHGGGIRLQRINGIDVEVSGARNLTQGREVWNRITVINNIVVNNVAGWAGGGISLQDTINAVIKLNTIANNDTTASVGALLVNGNSSPQAAGIASGLNSEGLAAFARGPARFRNNSIPDMSHNIVWHNRAFSFDNGEVVPSLTPTLAGECAAGAQYLDFGMIDSGFDLAGEAGRTLHSGTPGVVAEDLFLNEYCNGGRGLSSPGPLQITDAFAEAGNFIDVRYGPLTREWPVGSGAWDYHIGPDSDAVDFVGGSNAPDPTVAYDFDNESRPTMAAYDAGADEIGGGPVDPPPPPPPPPGEPSQVDIVSATLGDLNVAGTVLDLGSQNGTVSTDITLAVTGGSSVTFGILQINGSNRFEIGDENCSGATIGPNEACTVSIDFVANGNGNRVATLAAPHDAASGANPTELEIRGR